jgi:hypothetical protein
LLSKKITTDGKYQSLNTFINNERGQGSDIHFRFQLAYEKMVKNGLGIGDEIKYVFQEAYERYLDGNLDIYSHEGNPQYVLYQTWTGKIVDAEQIAKIRKAAISNLDKHPEAIKMYWGQVMFAPNASSLDELKERMYLPMYENIELYMPIENLVAASKKAKITDKDLLDKINWYEKYVTNNKDELAKYKEWKKLSDNNDTLCGFLIRRGFLSLTDVNKLKIAVTASKIKLQEGKDVDNKKG